MRFALATVAACLVLPMLAIPVDVVAASSSPATAVGPTGTYGAVDRVRALDTRLTGAIDARAIVKVKVTGLGDVPATEVVAISVNLTVPTPAVTGSLAAFADGTSFSGATMSFQAGRADQNFETIPVGASGLIDIRNNTASSLNLIVDILGYHTNREPEDSTGRYQPMTPTRLLDTRTGQPVATGQTRTFQVAGQAGIPPQGTYPNTVAAVINFTVLTPSQSGSLSVGQTGTQNTASISFAAGQTEQGQLLTLPDSGGGLPIRNNSAAAIQLIADVVGYYTGVDTLDGPQGANANQTFAVGGGREYDSRIKEDGPVPPGGTVELALWYLVAYREAPNGIGAVSMNLTVLTPSTDGSISAWPDSTPWDGAATVSFAAHQTRQRTVMLATGQNGDVLIRNNSNAPITLIVDLTGWKD